MTFWVFVLILFVVIRAACFGIFTIRENNISGGVAVLLLCALTLGCALYLMFRGT